jgi:CRP-like cAMP-binding protein
MSERLVPSGEIVQRAGDPADAFVVVLDGAVTASFPGGDAAPALGPGDTFGEVGLLKGAPRAETLRTTRTSRLLVLPRDAFVALVTAHDLLPTEIGALMRRRHVATLLAGALPGLEGERLGSAAAETTFFVADVGAVIVHQGDTADAFYVVVDGRTEVLRDGPAGVQQVAEIGPGEFFGEAGLLRALPRSATVRARERAELLRVTRVGFDALVSGTEPRGGIARAMVERLLRDAK